MEFSLLNSFVNAAKLSLKLIIVITLLMIAYEFFENSKLYTKLQSILERPLEKVGFTPNSSITMVVGLVLGIAYGAGILIRNAMSGKMSGKEILLSSLFLSVCHAVFEDTLLFVAIGGNGVIILGTRIFLAITVAMIITKYVKL
ncbi:nucleoside recognition protein [Deferribacter autotrophicus]|uniref:Nucleoside recognition protein n=1 Tax=Deferribacter autotrophicus TaxID=500465 RepID=A0A5A8F3R5_9BACT|nr:nucleoside recognition protein [Deferribacter autotrophicus]KAA0257673.1 nucleoside recognition protein [Deferribacter autotrophicus]